MPIERTSDNILIIRDTPTGIYPKIFAVTTEIDLPGRIIRKTWKAFVFVWQKDYPLDDYETAEIYDKSRLIEGYPLSFFAVCLAGRGRRLKIYSTDDAEDAKAVQVELSCFLEKTCASTHQPKSG